MNDTTNESILGLLPEAALDLFENLAGAHMGSTGNRRFLLALSGSGTSLVFTGQPRVSIDGVDTGALDELVEQRLLREKRPDKGSTNYSVTAAGEAFYAWSKQRIGSAIDQVDVEVQSTVDGPGFRERHPEAEQHLDAAFTLLWQKATDIQTVSTIGDHLRKALMDATTVVVGADVPGEQEQPIKRLGRHLDRLSVSPREAKVLKQIVELADAVLRLDHRLNHMRDEVDKGQTRATWEELRRASFVTAFTCYELDRLAQRE